MTYDRSREARRDRNRLLTLTLLLLGACSSVPPQVAPAPTSEARVVGEVLLDPAAPPTEAPEREVFEAPEQLPGNAMPIYPAALLTAGLAPHTVSVRIVVNADGSVARVMPLPDSDDQVPGYQPFFDAVHAAVMQWRFEPFRVVHWAEGPDLDGDGEGDSESVVGEETRPFRFDMRFRFEVVDGKAQVSS